MPPLMIPQALQMALNHLQADQLPQAETLLRQILAQDPNQPDALHFLGVLAQRVGRSDLALDLMTRSVAIAPWNPIPFCNLGEVYRMLGRLEEAEAACRKAVELDPNFGAAYLNLGTVLGARKHHAEAITAFQKVLQLQPGNAKALTNLGLTLQEMGRKDEARTTYEQALALDPNLPDAHANLGTLYHEQGRYDEAIAAYQRSIELDPNNSGPYNNLSDIMVKLKRFDEGIALARRAIELKPEAVEAKSNLGHALQAAGRCDEAIVLMRELIERHPTHFPAYNNLGNAYHRKSMLPEAIATYRKGLELNPDQPFVSTNLALALYKNDQDHAAVEVMEELLRRDPDNAEGHFHIALSLLHLGEFASAWEHYEWRWKCSEYRALQRPSKEPIWEGGDITGKTILLHAEQGFGDALQFIRYVPMVVQRVGAQGAVWLECQPEVKALLATVGGLARVYARGEAVPIVDYHCPLLSLPRAFGTNLTNIPAAVPYLSADPARVAQWQERLAAVEKKETGRRPLRVGLSWAGRPQHADDKTRSCTLAHFAPLGAVPGVQFYSLQKGLPAEQIQSAPFPLHDFMPDVQDFTDSAALVANLDLVITVDTAPAHLAGALAKPVWTLLAFSGEWRWLRERTDSPWYPTMRLFRQRRLQEWEPVLAEVAGALREWTATQRTR